MSREDKLKTIKAWGLIKMRWRAQRGEGYLTLTLTLLVLSPLLTLQERRYELQGELQRGRENQNDSGHCLPYTLTVLPLAQSVLLLCHSVLGLIVPFLLLFHQTLLHHLLVL